VLTSEPGPTVIREYAFRSGCAAMGCVVIFLCALGLVSTFAMGFGLVRIQNGEGFQFALGIAITALCGLGMCALLLAPVMLYYAVQEARRPQFLFVTTVGIQLPSRLVMPQLDAKGRPVPDAPPRQPQVIPFSAIRRISREDGSGGSQVLIEHDLRPEPLGIAQYLMTPADFDDFVKVLRELVPSAFTPPPPDTK
jgi:hypothetical protein